MEAAPGELGEEVAPAKPVTGMVVEASLSPVPVGLAVEACEALDEVLVALPLKGSWAPHGWSLRHESAQAF